MAIRRGELQPGQRLLPQRQFAWQRKIAISTATRVYAELTRRGLVSGEVGRGTFVVERFPSKGALGVGTIDMERNYPEVDGQGKPRQRGVPHTDRPLNDLHCTAQAILG